MLDITKPSPALVASLRRKFRPLVKFLLASGITYPILSELLKGIFIEVAENDFQLPGKEQTDSRINFLTGIHRKEVKRLRNTRHNDLAIPESVPLGTQLVARWIGNQDYLDQEGSPLPLPRLIKQGGKQSFEALVTSVSRDIRSRAILDEWLNLGVVNIDEHDRVCLNIDAFVPENGYDEKAHFFGDNLHDHIAAAAHNMLGNKPPFLERAVFYDQLTVESINKIAELAEQSGMEVLKKINRCSLELQEADKNAENNVHRYRLGIYFFSETETKPCETGK